jgi:hypothetical protein
LDVGEAFSTFSLLPESATRKKERGRRERTRKEREREKQCFATSP